jgi:hypothetical protein
MGGDDFADPVVDVLGDGDDVDGIAFRLGADFGDLGAVDALDVRLCLDELGIGDRAERGGAAAGSEDAELFEGGE